MRRFVFPIATVSLAVIAACSGDTGGPGHAVIAVKISPDNPVVLEGAPIAFRATAITETGEAKDVSDSPSTTWLSSDPGVVEVNADGAGEATGPGSAFVTARNSGITSPAQNVTVNPIPTTPPPTPTPTPAPTADHVVISEVLYTAATDPGGEFIELHNPTGSPVVLDDWRIARDGPPDGTETTYFTFPAATTIAAGGYVVVCNTPATCGVGGAFDSSNNTAMPATTGEYFVLLNSTNVVIDEMAYGSGNNSTDKPAGWCATNLPAANATAGNSVQRKPVGSDGETCDDWISNTAATPLAAPP